MSKKNLILILCIVATLALTLGTTLAYLTDSDTKVNTFTVGNVDITVDEEFEDNAPLAPGATVDKLARLTNSGATAAWVWMTVAVPADVDPYITLNWADGVTLTNADGETMTGDDGEEYVVYTILVDEQLAAGASTEYMLESVTLSELVDYQDNEYVAVEDGVVTPIGSDLSELDVIVSGYAVQIEGFDTVEEAYEAYGDQWGTIIPTTEDGTATQNIVPAKAGVKTRVEGNKVIAIMEKAELDPVTNSAVYPAPGYYPEIEINLPAEYDAAVSTYIKKTNPTGAFSAPALISTLDTDNDNNIQSYIVLIPGVNLETFQNENRNPMIEYQFDWEGDGTYDQIVVFTVDLLGGDVVLNP